MAESYWKDVKLQDADGRELIVTLDVFTANRLLAGDAELTRTILQNVNEAVTGGEPVEASAVTSLSALPVESSESSPAEKLPSSSVSESTDPEKKIWLDKETKMFVTVRVEAEDRFMTAKVHKRLWTDIANKMKEGGVDVTSEQCCNKWKAIKRAYKETIDHNKLTGADRKNCKFYEELDTLYGTRAGTSPAFTLGTMKPNKATCTDVQGSSSNSNREAIDLSVSDSDSDNNDVVKTQTPARKLRKKCKTATVQWLEQHAAKQAEMQKRRDEQSLKMHDDKMRRIDRLLDVLERNGNK